MTFLAPGWLLAGVAVAVALVFLIRVAERRSAAHAFAYSNLDLLVAAARPSRFAAAAVVASVALGTALLGAAIARPHLVASVPARDGAVVLCIDTSGSMAALDIAPNRSAAASAAARAFVEAVPAGTRVGIVSFATGAEVVQPLTRNRDEARDAIGRIPAPNGATAIGDALSAAGRLLPERGRRIVVLLTDGVNNRGADPLEVARFLGARHVPVYTIGIGTSDSGQLIPGTAELADLDEDALRNIAQAAGGRYVRARDAAQLRAAFSDLARSTIWERRRIDASLPFAAAGGLLILGGFVAAVAAGRFP